MGIRMRVDKNLEGAVIYLKKHYQEKTKKPMRNISQDGW
jgi:hypothetical protein